MIPPKPNPFIQQPRPVQPKREEQPVRSEIERLMAQMPEPEPVTPSYEQPVEPVTMNPPVAEPPPAPWWDEFVKAQASLMREFMRRGGS